MLPRRGYNQETFSHALDIWSLGCMVHELLTSQTPFLELDLGPAEVESDFTDFEPEVNLGCMYEYCQGIRPFPSETLLRCQVAAEGVDFVQRLLTPSPEARPTAAAAMEDPWLHDTGYTSDFCQVLAGECLDLGFVLLHMDNWPLMRQIQTRDVVNYLPESVPENLSLLLARALINTHRYLPLLLMKSETRKSKDHDGVYLRGIFERAAKDGRVGWMKVLVAGGWDVNTLLRDGRTALQVAVERGHLGMLQLLVENGADVNLRSYLNATPSKENFQTPLRAGIEASYNGRSMLRIASFLGRIEIVELLLVNKAEVNAGTGMETALMGAINGGHTQIVELLLNNKANITANRTCQMPLRTAIANGNSAILSLLLDHGADANTNFRGRTALQMAVESGHTDIVKMLLDNEARVNDELNGRRVLQIAIQRRQPDIVSQLLDRNAHIHITENSHTAFLAAVTEGRVEIVELLLDRDPDVARLVNSPTILHIAVVHGHTEMAEMILTHKAYIQTAEGIRARFLSAVRRGFLALVILFISQHSDANTTDEYGRTALYMAVDCEDTEMVKILVASKANVNNGPFGETGRTVLQLAAERGLIDIVQHLLENGADVDAKSSKENGRTALEAAVEQGHLNIVKVLLDHNAQINAKPSQANGRTVLGIAIANGHSHIAIELLARKAAVNEGWGSRAPLQIAVDCGDLGIMKLLLSYGAAINARGPSKNDLSLLQRAVAGGNLDLVKILLAEGANVNTPPVDGGFVDTVKRLFGIDAPLNDRSALTKIPIAVGKQRARILDLLSAYEGKQKWSVLRADFLLLAVVGFFSDELPDVTTALMNTVGGKKSGGGPYRNNTPLNLVAGIVWPFLKAAVALVMLGKMNSLRLDLQCHPLARLCLAAQITATNLWYPPGGVMSISRQSQDGLFTPLVLSGISFLLDSGGFKHAISSALINSPFILRLITILPNSKAFVARPLLELLFRWRFGNVSHPSYAIRCRILEYFIHLTHRVWEVTRWRRDGMAGGSSNYRLTKAELVAVQRLSVAFICCVWRMNYPFI